MKIRQPALHSKAEEAMPITSAAGWRERLQHLLARRDEATVREHQRRIANRTAEEVEIDTLTHEIGEVVAHIGDAERAEKEAQREAARQKRAAIVIQARQHAVAIDTASPRLPSIYANLTPYSSSIDKLAALIPFGA
jgi:hypothetical protein